MEAKRKATFSEHFYSSQTSEWKEMYCEYDELIDALQILKKNNRNPEQVVLRAPGEVDISEETVSDRFRREVDKVSEFYLHKLAEYQDRFQKLCLFGSRVCLISAFDEFAGGPPPPDEGKERPAKEQASNLEVLKKAISQLYRGSLMLYNFALLNNTAFVQLFEEFDRIAVRHSSSDIFDRLHHADFSQSLETARLRDRLESLYSRVFLQGKSSSHAREQLAARRHDKRDLNMYLIGFFFGTSVPLFILWLLSGLVTRSQISEISDTFLALLPLFRFVWIIILGLWMYGLDTLVWHRARINYQFIFEYNPRTALGYRSLFLWASLLLSIFCTFLFLDYNYLVSLFTVPLISLDTGLWLWPTVMLGMVAVILLFPFNFFWRSSRICFALTSLQVFISPFGTLGFREFFVGDVYTSLVKTLFDFEYTVCYYVHGDFLVENDATCNQVNNIMLPIISVLPLYWRFAQCIKRYFVTREKVHIANALKYATATLVVLFSTLNGNFQRYDPGDWPPTRVLWLISFVFSTLYTYLWDVFMDWGLGRPQHKFLRDRLVWKHNKWFYYYCIVSNFIFRFFWAVTITPFAVSINMQPEMLNLIAASIEIIRRFTWAILRLENEHLNNCGKFRAINFIPLPFDVNQTQEPEKLPDGSVSYVSTEDHSYASSDHPLPITSHERATEMSIPILDSPVDFVFGTPRSLEERKYFKNRVTSDFSVN